MSVHNDDRDLPGDEPYDDLEQDMFSEDHAADRDMDVLDEDMSSLDDPLDEADWEDQPEDAPADAGPQQTPRKKSSLLLYAGIGIAVLAGLGWFFSTTGGDEAPVAVSESAPAEPGSLEALREEASKEAQLQTPPSEQEPPAPVSQGFMNEAPAPAPAESAPQDTAATGIVVPPVEAPGAALPPAETLPSPQDPEPALSSPEPVSDFPSVDLIKKAGTPEDASSGTAPQVDTAPPATVAESSAPSPAPTLMPDAPVPAVTASPAAPAASDDTALADLQIKLTAAESRILSLEKELDLAKREAAAAAEKQQVPATGDDVASLKRTIQDLERKLAAKADSAEASTATRAESVPNSVTPSVAGQQENSSPVPAQSSAAPVRPAAEKARWELRGIQPGQAVLSRKGGSGDIRTVNIGDTVPGLGKILSIELTPKGWVVQGSMGKVTQ